MITRLVIINGRFLNALSFKKKCIKDIILNKNRILITD